MILYNFCLRSNEVIYVYEIKVKVKLSSHYEGVLGEWIYRQLHAFLTSALDGGEWSASRFGRPNPRERASVTHWIGGWVGFRTGPDTVAKKKYSQPLPRPETPIIQPIAQRYTTELVSLIIFVCYNLHVIFLTKIIR
jgi:hypothetical protein